MRPPAWLDELRSAVAPELRSVGGPELRSADVPLRPEQLARFRPPETGGRAAAVLMLFGEGPDGPDVLLMRRSSALRNHAGQAAFPGGAADPGDRGPTGTALREAAEEVGVIAAGVSVLAELPALFLPPSGFVVTPVLAWWQEPSEVRVVDPAETASVARVPIAELVDSGNRFRIRHPSGYVGPAFSVRGLLVWGFTAGLLDGLLSAAGWTRPWNDEDVRELPAELLAAAGNPAPAAGTRAMSPAVPDRS